MNMQPLKPGERPACDQAAWRLVYGGPVLATTFWAKLAAEGAPSEDIAKAVRLLELVARDGLIGHRCDLPVSGRRGVPAGVAA